MHHAISDDKKRSSETINLPKRLEGAEKVSCDIDYQLPVWKPVDGRIPYTFEPRSYCLSFYQSGVCSNLENGEQCIDMHFREGTIHTKAFEVYEIVNGQMVHVGQENSGNYCVGFAHKRCRKKVRTFVRTFLVVKNYVELQRSASDPQTSITKLCER